MNAIRDTERRIVKLKRELDSVTARVAQEVNSAQTEDEKLDARGFGDLDIMEVSNAIRHAETQLMQDKLSRFDIAIPPSHLQPSYWQNDMDGERQLSDEGLFHAKRRLRQARLENRAFWLQIVSILLAALASAAAILQAWAAIK